MSIIKRRVCLNCGKPIGPLFQRPTADFPRLDMPTRSHSISAMDPDGFFCTLRCAARYGVRAALDGKGESSHG